MFVLVIVGIWYFAFFIFPILMHVVADLFYKLYIKTNKTIFKKLWKVFIKQHIFTLNGIIGWVVTSVYAILFAILLTNWISIHSTVYTMKEFKKNLEDPNYPVICEDIVRCYNFYKKANMYLKVNNNILFRFSDKEELDDLINNKIDIEYLKKRNICNN